MQGHVHTAVHQLFRNATQQRHHITSLVFVRKPKPRLHLDDLGADWRIAGNAKAVNMMSISLCVCQFPRIDAMSAIRACESLVTVVRSVRL